MAQEVTGVLSLNETNHLQFLTAQHNCLTDYFENMKLKDNHWSGWTTNAWNAHINTFDTHKHGEDFIVMRSKYLDGLLGVHVKSDYR